MPFVAEDVFKALDTDGSGALSFGEFEKGFKEKGAPFDEAKFHGLIKELDKDGDGELNLEEFKLVTGTPYEVEFHPFA